MNSRVQQLAGQINALDAEIGAIVAAEAGLTRKHEIIISIGGTSTLPARHLGQWNGKSFIWGRRANVCQALYMPALVAARFNPALRAKYQQLIAAGKPAKNRNHCYHAKAYRYLIRTAQS